MPITHHNIFNSYQFLYFLLCLIFLSTPTFLKMRLDPLPYVNRRSPFNCHFSSSFSVSPYLFACFLTGLAVFYFQLLLSTNWQCVSNGVGWLNDFHDLSPILCDTVTILFHPDQFYGHCVFMHSNFHWQLVAF